MASGDEQKKLRKGPWTAAEDEKLKAHVKEHGEKKWNKAGNKLNRDNKSCRFRFLCHLKENLKKTPISQVEEEMIVQLHQQLGNKWATIAKQLQGRTDNEIKNFWNTRKKKLERSILHHHHPSLPPPSPTPNNNHCCNTVPHPPAPMLATSTYQLPGRTDNEIKISRKEWLELANLHPHHPSLSLPSPTPNNNHHHRSDTVPPPPAPMLAPSTSQHENYQPTGFNSCRSSIAFGSPTTSTLFDFERPPIAEVMFKEIWNELLDIAAAEGYGGGGFMKFHAEQQKRKLCAGGKEDSTKSRM
ncbi:Transcription factor GAMYB [Acorus calamus]|uniref:Transcription factor GAMYB n=1 Tax=Acorus calamus TaxID=4465 RepID=A0AAV9DU83_ACOCL|nr:Transcription factor GAMYB [Acorus calamus]